MEQVMRKCTKCGEEKELALFECKVNKGVQSYRGTCRPCRNNARIERFKSNPEKLEARNKRQQELLKSDPERLERKRARDRERERRLRVEDPERRKVIEAKRRETENYKQWSSINNKKRVLIDRANRLVERAGKTCPIELVDCVICGEKSFVKTDNVERKFGRRFCNKCKSKGVSVLGLKLERMIVLKNCSVCNKEFEGKVGCRQMCSECRHESDKAYRRAYKARRTAKGVRSGNSLRTRARKAGAYMDTVIPKKVYERDGWRCVSCKCKVHMCKAYHPKQASIDHIIPISMGGSHTYGNVQTMCVSCNSSKSDKITNNVQLTVFDMVRQ
jgi:hypothetical protein